MITYLIMIVPTLIVGVYGAWQSFSYIRNQLRNSLNIMTEHVKNQISAEVARYNIYFNFAVYDSRVVKTIKGNLPYDSRSFLNPFFSLIDSLDPKLHDVRIYVSGKVPDSYFFRSNENVINEEWYQRAIAANDAILHPLDDVLMIAERMQEFLIGKAEVVIAAKVRYTVLFYELDHDTTIDANLLIYDENNRKVLYEKRLSSSPALTDQIVNALDFADGKISVGGDIFFASVQDIPGTDWFVAAYLPRQAVVENASRILLITGLFGALGLLFALFMIYLLSRWIVRPLRHLNNEMKKVQRADFSVDIDVQSQNEIGELNRQFKAMAHHLEELIETAYKSEIATKEADLRALQAQINPHFLYNSLSAINMEALRIDAVNIHKMVTSLASFYRTALNKGRDLIHLSEEMVNVHSYLDIWLIMSDHSFDVEYHVADGLSEYYVINLLLQPLVENAIEHGIEKINSRGCIMISAHESDDCVVLQVEDNGPGMDRREIFDTHSDGYGLKSVQSRIQLKFGEQYGLSLSNAKPTGTVAKIVLPKVLRSVPKPPFLEKR